MGGPLLLDPKDGTPGCTIEAHNFQRDLAKYEQYHAVIVGVSVDSTGSHREFCAKQGLHIQAAGRHGEICFEAVRLVDQLSGYRISARNTFLVNPEGRIAKVWIGVDPGRHSADVLAILAQISRPPGRSSRP